MLVSESLRLEQVQRMTFKLFEKAMTFRLWHFPIVLVFCRTRLPGFVDTRPFDVISGTIVFGRPAFSHQSKFGLNFAKFKLHSPAFENKLIAKSFKNCYQYYPVSG